MSTQRYDRAVWEDILSHGSLNIGDDRLTVDIREGLPSVTLSTYPDKWSAVIVEELRWHGWLLPFRMTIQLSPAFHRTHPSMVNVATIVRTHLEHAQRIAQRDAA